MLTNRQALIIIANTAIVASFVLGWFFNATTPSFIPTGTPVPTTTGCDLLSSFTRLCFPNVVIPLVGGTLLLNFDILITFLSLSGLIFGLVVLHKETPE